MKFRIRSLIAFMILSSFSAAQALPAMTQTLRMEEGSITAAYPETWSVVSPRYANAYELIQASKRERLAPRPQGS